MQKCTATRVVTIPSGLFDLDENQVKRRTHMLKKTENGYEIKQSIQFKKGETFGYQGPINRELAEAIGVSEDEAKKINEAHQKAEKEKAEAEQKETGSVGDLLDDKVKVVIGKLTGLSDDDLVTLLEEEQAGKARAGVMDAIETELSARDNT